jgi:hypothetical protein
MDPQELAYQLGQSDPNAKTSERTRATLGDCTGTARGIWLWCEKSVAAVRNGELDQQLAQASKQSTPWKQKRAA